MVTSSLTLPSLLDEPARHTLRPPEYVASLGVTLVLAPHPDDESLGCGGLLALLAEHRKADAHVLIMTDGSRSHPNSLSYPASRLAALREDETISALAALGLPVSAARFWRYPDCGLPAAGTPAFTEASAYLAEIFRALQPETILSPWRRDPHCDHEATWALGRAALALLASPPRWLEYPVWSWTSLESKIAPQAEEGLQAWRLDISPALARKRKAVAQHRSQLGEVIHDDPAGFQLAPAMLLHFERPWELFLESTHV